MTGAFERSWARLKLAERGYSNNPFDRGGPTKFGITQEVARANGYDGPMEELDESTAKRIAKKQYWDQLRLDQVTESGGEAIAYELFDTGYNMGIVVAGRFLQRWLNALNRRGRAYPDLSVDGLVGPITVARLRDYVVFRGWEGKAVLFKALNCSQGERYLEIAERDESQEEFLYGWVRARVEV